VVFSEGNKLLSCENGVNTDEGEHIIAEQASSLKHEFKRKSLPAIALFTDTSFITAASNDFGYETLFEKTR